MLQRTNLWFTKSRRAQNEDDYETWIEGGVMPTLNAFDNGDVRTTVLVMRMREGKPGGGKGPLMSEDKSLTLATSNDQSLFIFSHTQGLDPQPSKKVSPTLRMNGGGMALAYDEFNDSVAETHHTLRAGTKQSTGVIAPTLSASNNPSRSPQSSEVTAQIEAMVKATSIVRRLTPVECERLQGFPDDWTAGQSDSTRYKQMGNAVAVPVVEWLIGNICDIV